MLPEMIFVLASPRSGSTLLRAMLAGHPDIFGPPELNLLPFFSMGQREMNLGAQAFCTMPCDQRVGLIEAVMHLTGRDAHWSASWLQQFIYRNASIAEMYHVLREMAGHRRLLDKSSLNSSCVDFLQRTRWLSPAAHYIHLVRHPHAVVESLQRTYFQNAEPWEGFQAAEALWTVPNQNACRFLEMVPASQQHFVRFEDLVREPEAEMQRICTFLGLAYHDSVLTPYDGDRMTRGSPGLFESLGDPNFNAHSHIDASLGDAWRSVELPWELDPLTTELASRFQYELPQKSARGGNRQQSGSFILVVPPFTYRADAYIDAAHRLGFSTIIALDPRYGVPENVDEYLPIQFEYPECAAQMLTNYAWSRPVAGILSVDDGGAEVASIACRALQLPHNPVEALWATRDKYTMRGLFKQAGAPSPEFNAYQLCEDPSRIAQGLSFPVVLKPLHLTGSRGVIRANNSEEFAAAFSRVARLLDQPGMGPDPKLVLVERYIPGVELSVDGILVDGRLRPLAIYDKPDPMEGPFFEETIFTTPSRQPLDVQERIIACAELAARALGLRMGPVHVELRLNEHGPWLLEVAARTMGGYCSRALPFEAGRTLEELVVSQTAGRPIDEFVPAPGSYGVMMLPIPGEGVYRGIKGANEAEAVPGITGLMISIPVGTMVTPLPEGDKYVGFLFAQGDDPTVVERALRDAHACLSLELDPAIGSSWTQTREYDQSSARFCR